MFHPEQYLSADVQVLVAHVHRLMGTRDLGVLRLPLVSRSARRGRTDPLVGASQITCAAPVGRIIAVLGGFFGFYVAGYTGVLLAVTNRPIWSDTPLLGLLFIVSAASTSSALMILLAYRSGRTTPAVADLHRMDDGVIVLELLVLIAVMVSLGPVLSAWLNVWGSCSRSSSSSE